jgi:CBS-domain-containing membrane protein
VHDAARYFRDKQVRSAGVCDRNGVLLGVISQSDISQKVAAENRCPAWMPFSEILTRQLVTVTPETSMEDCLRLMDQHGIYHRLVVDSDLGFRGMISVTDLLPLFASDQKARADRLEAWIFPVRSFTEVRPPANCVSPKSRAPLPRNLESQACGGPGNPLPENANAFLTRLCP